MGLMAVLSPPLQAPDEPDHFMGYLIATGQKSRINELKEFAKRSHFERIKFRKDQFFRAADVDQPYPLSWGKHVVAARIEARSSLGTWVWQKYSSVISKDSGIGPTILQLRIFNGCLWTFAWICFFIAASKFGRDIFKRQLNQVLYLLLIPVLPFFAMHISDFSLVVPIVVASVLCLGILPHSKSVIIPGVISGLIIQTSLLSNKAGASSLLLFCPLAWHALFCRVGGTRTARENVVQFLKQGSIFWIIAALIAATPFISPHETHIRTISRELARFYGVFPQLKSFLTIETYLLLGPIICGAALIGYFLLGGIGFSFIQFASQKVQHNSRELAKAFLTLSIGLIAISILYSLVASHLPQLQNIEIPNKPPFLEYERNILKVLLSSLRLTDLDFYLQATFWGGFGWLESMPSPWFLGLQNSLFIMLLIKFVLYWRQSNPTYGAVISATWAIISLLLVSLLAYILISRNFNIHGRYLIPVYLLNLGFLLVRRPDPKGDDTARIGLSTKNWMVLAYPYFYGYAYLMLIQRYLG